MPEELKPIMVKFRGEPKELKITFGAMKVYREKTGKNLLKGEISAESEDDMAALFWACLRRYDPKLTIEEIMDDFGVAEMFSMMSAWQGASGGESAPLVVTPANPPAD